MKDALHVQKQQLLDIAKLVLTENTSPSWIIYANVAATAYLDKDFSGTSLDSLDEVETYLDLLISNYNDEMGLAFDIARSRAVDGDLNKADEGQPICWVTLSFKKGSTLTIEDEEMGGKTIKLEAYDSSQIELAKEALIEKVFPSDLSFVSWGNQWLFVAIIINFGIIALLVKHGASPKLIKSDHLMTQVNPATNNILSFLKITDSDMLSTLQNTDVTFVNQSTSETFDGTITEHRNTEELYVRVPTLRDSIQRVRIEDVTQINKYVVNGEEKPLA